MIYLIILLVVGLETENCLNPEINNKGMVCSWEREDFRILINEREGLYDVSQMKRHNPNDNKIEAAMRKRYWEKKNEEWRAERELDTTSKGGEIEGE